MTSSNCSLGRVLLLSTFVLALYPTVSTALQWDATQHAFYSDDVDQDGDKDLILRQKPEWVFINNQGVNFPVNVGPDSWVLSQDADGLYQPEMINSSSTVDTDRYESIDTLYNLFEVDLNSDGLIDLAMQAKTKSYKSFYLVSDANETALDIHYLEHADLSVSADRVSWSFEDSDQDAHLDLVFKYAGERVAAIAYGTGSGLDDIAINLDTDDTVSNYDVEQNPALLQIQYETYQVDYNGDGYLDILLKAKPEWHVVAVAPYQSVNNGPKEHLLLSQNAQGYTLTTLSLMTPLNTASYTPLTNQYNVMVANLGSDNSPDILLQALNSNDESLVVHRTDTGNQLQTLSAPFSLGADTVAWHLDDVNGDSVTDLVFSGQQHSGYTQLESSGASLVITDTSSDNHVVGTLQGQFEVTPSGAATYAIPINVPPGVNGIQPSLGLAFSSQSGQGIAGQGWGLSGLSTISRCPQDPSRDNGSRDPVDYDDNDQFCIDGMRLVPMPGQANLFAPEIDDDRRIEALPNAISPTSFKVTHGNGHVYQYGNTVDTRIHKEANDNSSAIFQWMVSEVSDPFSNTMYFTYTKTVDPVLGEELLIDAISYGNNNTIRFVYSDNSAVGSVYAAVEGPRVASTQRLDAIQVQANLATLFSYSLSYESADHLDTQILKQIQYCVGDGSSGECYPPTSVTWSQALNQSYTSRTAMASFPTTIFNGDDGSEIDRDLSRIKIMDINADGLSDVYYVSGRGDSHPDFQDKVLISKGDGTFWPVTGPVTYTDGGGERTYQMGRLHFGDFNGDALIDVFIAGTGMESDAEPYWKSGRIYLANQLGSYSRSRYIQGPIIGNDQDDPWEHQMNLVERVRLGDFDGNGMTDIYYIHGWKSAKDDDLYLFDENGMQPKITSNNTYFYNTPEDFSRFQVGDFNGDGLSDFYFMDRMDAEKNCALCNRYDSIYFGDPNSATRFTRVPVSGFEYKGHVRHNQYGFESARLRFADLDGNGTTDIYYINNSPDPRDECRLNRNAGATSTDKIYLSVGNGHFEYAGHGVTTFRRNCGRGENSDGVFSYYNTYPTMVADMQRTLLVDFDSNGLSDVYLAKGDGTEEVDQVHYAQLRTLTGSADRHFFQESASDVIATYISDDPKKVSRDLAHQKFGDFDGDGILDIYQAHRDNFGQAIHDEIFFGPDRSQRVVGITNGLGEQMEWTTLPLTQADYIGSADYDSYPNIAIRSAMPVVTEMLTEDGQGGFHTTTYEYQNYRMNTQGLGSLGFERVAQFNDATNIESESIYSHDVANRMAGSVLETRQTLIHDQQAHQLSYTSNQYRTEVTDGRYKTLLRLTGTLKSGPGAPTIATVTEAQYDDRWGVGHYMPETTTACVLKNPAEFDTAMSVGCISAVKQSQTVTTLDYYAAANDRPPLPRTKSVQSEVGLADEFDLPFNGSKIVTQTESYTYYPDGTLHTKTVHPDTAVATVQTYLYSNKGLPTQVKTSSPDIADRFAHTGYDPQGRVTARRNTLDHSETILYEDSRFPWLPTSKTSPNGITSYLYYDNMGQLIKTVSNGIASETSTEFCANTYCEGLNAHYAVESSKTGTLPATAYFDRYGREVAKRQYGLKEGEIVAILQETRYNRKGQVVRVSDPYYVGDTIYWIESLYDALGRPVKTVGKQDDEDLVESLECPAANDEEDSKLSCIAYNGLSTTYTNALGQTKTVTKNVLGQKVEVKDDLDGTIHYLYGPLGNLWQTTDASGNQVQIEYDAFGRKLQMIDPDQGNWHYTYYSDGKLKTQTDAKGQVTTTTYDLLGRVKTRTDHDGYAATWVYDTCAHGVGKLCSVSDTEGYLQTYTYDALGRPTDTITRMDNVEYQQEQSYDSLHRIATQTYPNGFQTQFDYHDELGHLERVSNVLSGEEYWRASSFTARGQLAESTLNNGFIKQSFNFEADTGRNNIRRFSGGAQEFLHHIYSWDALGNLDYRQDVVNSIDTDYAYDNLNRLTGTTTYGPDDNVMSSVAVNYDLLGNITSKGDVGTYQYNSPRPHAVTHAGNIAYLYDANGSVTKKTEGSTIHDFFYSPFGKQIRLESNNGDVTTFAYGPNRSRYKRVDTVSGETQTTYYLKNYEKFTDKTGQIFHKYYIGDYAVVQKQQTTGALKTQFLLRDHLGSVMAVLEDKLNMIEYKAGWSYDPWGKRTELNPSVEFDLLLLGDLVTKRGYTNHELIGSFGLLHMNGRVYDPTVGRFLQADPLIQAPGMTQSYNRYSYVMNNPLRFTDPSGYSWFSKKWKQIRRAVITIAAFAVGAMIGCPTCTLSMVFKTAAAMKWGMSFAAVAHTYRSARDNGAGIGDSVRAGAKAGIVAYAAGTASSALGNTVRVLQNGSINWLHVLPNFIGHALIGGLSSAVMGGDFRDGAKVSVGTAAFVKLGLGLTGIPPTQRNLSIAGAIASYAVAKENGGDPWFSIGIAMVQTWLNAGGGGEAALKIKAGLGILKGEFDLLSSSKKGSIDLTEKFGVEFDTEGTATVTQGDKALSLTTDSIKELSWGKKFLGVNGTAKYIGNGDFQFEGQYKLSQARLIPFFDVEFSYSTTINVSLNGGLINRAIKLQRDRHMRALYGDD